MSQDQDSPSQLSGLFGPALIVAIGGLVAYFTIEPALESRRPDLSKRTLVPPPPAAPGLNALHSRLWDDPLAVAYEDSQRRHREGPKSSQSLGSLLQHALCLNSGQEELQRYFESVAQRFLDLRHGNGKFLCLPVLVPGEPYDSDTEDRKRITYAVLSALGCCGYELSAPDRVSYVELPMIVQIPALDESVCLERFVVPAKLFQRTDVPGRVPNRDGPDGVMVLWINEDQLGRRPLAAIGQVLEGLFGKFNSNSKNRIDLRIIGPVSSDTLLGMALEDADWEAPSATDAMGPAYRAATERKYFSRTYGTHDESPRLFSGRATISALVFDKETETRSPRSILSDFTGARSTNSGLSVVRTIGSDWQLAQVLARELILREAWPRSDDAAHPSHAARHIVLVTESDSLYGRALPAVLRKAFPKSLNSSEPATSQPEDMLHVFTYLRGLDGKIPGVKKEDDESHSENKAQDSDSDPLRAQNTETIPASGRSQFDYLRRLEQQLVEIDQASRDAGQEGIKAIGVVGSDIYDKLLVLRALRKRFPRTWFFSTDLDAALSLPSEYPTTRNLIVASHFGLTLNPQLQRSALPFRDVYQTATYFSTLLALDDDAAQSAISKARDPWGLDREVDEDASESSTLDPLVFEIGRSGPYQLTIPARETSPSNQRVHPPGPRESHWLDNAWHACALLALIVLAGAGLCCLSENVREGAKVICCGWRRRDWNPKRIISRIVVLLLAGLFLFLVRAAVIDHTNPSGEPFVMFEGISIWPTSIIRFIVIVLSIGFIGRAILDARGDRPRELHRLCERSAGPAETPSHCGALVEAYCARASLGFHVVWTLTPATAFALFSLLLLNITERPPRPFRGPSAEQWQFWVLSGAAISLIYLTFLVVAHVESCRRFVKALGESPADFSAAEVRALHTARQPLAPADLGELEAVRIIAESTEAVGKSIKYPFIALFVMILSQHPALDKLEFPWALIAIWALMMALLFWAAHAMRRDAGKAREQALGRLRDALSSAMNPKGAPSHASLRVQQLQQYIAEIESEDRGAFQPLIRDPLIQALTLGTSGGLMLIHQLLPHV
ncbi:MAG TPA: hypothetical protein VKU82_14000 [Planctomycetaceae bacterium]|nr:hypothetical protein [Planctomycetaceae bacterium]